MSEKFLKYDNGELVQKSSISQSLGTSDGGKLIALDPVTGKLHQSLMPSGIGADTTSIVASENLNAGDLINIWDDGGVAKARKANNSTKATRAMGFVLDSVLANQVALIYHEGNNNQLSNLVAGEILYLDGNSGAVTNAPPATPNSISQKVGYATSPTSMNVEFGQIVIVG